MNFKISWARVFLTTQILSVVLCVVVVYYALPPFIKAVTDGEDSNQSKTVTKLLPQVHLSNQDDCADVVVVEICKQGNCQYHVNSFHVLCKELLEKD